MRPQAVPIKFTNGCSYGKNKVSNTFSFNLTTKYSVDLKFIKRFATEQPTEIEIEIQIDFATMINYVKRMANCCTDNRKIAEIVYRLCDHNFSHHNVCPKVTRTDCLLL